MKLHLSHFLVWFSVGFFTTAPASAAEQAANQPRIKALVFVASAGEIHKQGLAAQDLSRLEPALAVDVSRLPLLQDRRFVSVIAGMLDQPLDAEAIAKLQAKVNAYLQLSGQGLAYVSVPEQDATSGVVQVLVMQPRLGKLTVEGARIFPEDSYREAIRLQPGGPIDQTRLNEDLDWIKRSNSFHSAAVVAKAGQNPGETDLDLRVSEKAPWAFNVSADNTGLDSTGRGRVNLGVTWGNAFGRGEVASYTLSADPTFNHYVTHTFGYVIPLRNRALINLSANYATIKPKMPDPLAQEGHSGEARVRYDVLLAPIGGYSHDVSFGADYKTSDTNVLFSATPVFSNRTEIVQAALAYGGSRSDEWGRTSFRVGMYLSPGGIGSRNTDEAFAVSRALAESSYHYQTLNVERLTNLFKGWSWTFNLRGQIASANLLGTEQMAVTGTYNVRGIVEGRLYADQGILLRNEVSPSPFAFGEKGRAQAYVFADAARVSNVDKVDGEISNSRLISAGLGIRFSLNDKLSGRLETGRPTSSNVPGINTNSHYVHLGVVYQF